MRDDPEQIADHLEKEHGLEAALSVVDNGKTEANYEGDYYTLSVWREVKVILQNRVEVRDGNKG